MEGSTVERVGRFIAAAGKDGLRQPEQRLSTASCLVIARMLIDPDFAEFMLTGLHPISGWTSDGSVTDRFNAQVPSAQDRAGGYRGEERLGPGRWFRSVGMAPWTAARQLSWTAEVGHRPVRDLWYVARLRRRSIFDRMARAVTHGRPGLLYVGSRWRPAHTVLVLDSDESNVQIYEPAEGLIQKVEGALFVTHSMNLRGCSTPWFIVTPTGHHSTI